MWGSRSIVSWDDAGGVHSPAESRKASAILRDALSAMAFMVLVNGVDHGHLEQDQNELRMQARVLIS